MKVISFNGRSVIEPGAYAQTLGLVQTAVPQGSSSVMVWVDTGNLNPNFAWGAGISGDFGVDKTSIYYFPTAQDVKTAVGGGILYGLADVLFKPSKSINVPGISGLYYVRAATTTAASVTFTFTGGGANGGTFTFKTIVEGLAGNGATNGLGSSLSRGFGAQMVAGRLDPAKFRIIFYRGTYRDVNALSTPSASFDGKLEAETTPTTIVETTEFSNATELAYFVNNDRTFKAWFRATTTTVTGTGAITAADLTANSTLKLFASGTQTYSTGSLDSVLDAIKELDYTFIMSDRYGSTSTDTYSTKIATHIKNSSFYEQFYYVAGGDTKILFDDTTDTTGGSMTHSVQIAGYFNTPRVHVVHGAVVRASPIAGQGNYTYGALYNAALIVGRTAGNAPQVPVTWADIDIEGVTHELKLTERERAIQTGVMHLRNVPEVGGWVVNLDNNSMQTNQQDIYSDGTSPFGSVMRIASSLNKGIIQMIRSKFIAMKNANTSSPVDVKAAIQTYLNDQVASPTSDDLILSYRNVTVNLVGSDYQISYAFTPNGPINRFFITSFMLPVNLSA